MTEDRKILQALVDGQAAIRADIKEVKDEVKQNTMRIKRLHASLVYLENDVPTNLEFNKPEKRVTKLEKRVALN